VHKGDDDDDNNNNNNNNNFVYRPQAQTHNLLTLND